MRNAIVRNYLKKTVTDRVLRARESARKSYDIFLNLSLRKQSEAYYYDVCDWTFCEKSLFLEDLVQAASFSSHAIV